MRDCPRDDIPEVAFAGRSNAGKSSAINRIAGSTALARVSKTPGRTQLINFFESSEGRLVDLPGFGYAKASRRKQVEWQDAVNRYLVRRTNLVGVVLIMDSRHPLQPFDVDMIQWSIQRQIRLVALLSKSDKLKQGERSACLRNVNEAVSGCENPVTVMFSSLKGTGVDEARQSIRSMWHEAGDPISEPSSS